MRHFVLTLVALAFLTSNWALTAQQTQDQAKSQGVADLIDKLGSSKFAERDRAMKELEAIGPAALPELRKALKSADAEIRRRTELLVRKFEDIELTNKLLTGKSVRLNLKDVTITAAVAELAKQSGYAVETGAVFQKAEADKRITLDTGDTTFWEALEQICQKASLVETSPGKSGIMPFVPPPAVAPPAGGAKIAAKALPAAKAVQIQPLPGRVLTDRVPAVSAAIALTPGKPNDAPTSFSGSVRIRLEKVSRAPDGHIDLVLTVTGEPRLTGFASAGPPRVDKAIDNREQQLAPVFTPAAPGPNAAINNGMANIAVANNLGVAVQVWTAAGPMTSTTTPGFKSFQTTIRLKLPAKPAENLQIISGKMPVQCSVESGPVFEVDNILKASGKKTEGKDGATLSIVEVREEPNTGNIQLRISMEYLVPGLGGNALPQIAPPQIQVQAQGVIQNVQQGQVQAIMQNVQQAQFTTTRSSAPATMFTLLDAKGEALAFVGLQASSNAVKQGKVTQSQTLVFRQNPGQGPASKLVLPGYRVFAFEVPFTLKGVILP